MAGGLREAHADFLLTSVGTNALLRLPNREGLLVRVHSVHLMPGDGHSGGENNRRYGISHDLSHILFPLDPDDLEMWVAFLMSPKAAADTGQGHGADRYFDPPYVWMVGNQNVLTGAGDNTLTVGRMSVYYDTVEIPTQEWAALVRSTTIETP